MTTLQVLKQVRKLLSKPENWVQGFYTYGKDNLACDWRSPDACKFCLLGAIKRVSQVHFFLTHSGCLWNIYSFAQWNDTPKRTHKEVIELLDKTIAWVKKNENVGNPN